MPVERNPRFTWTKLNDFTPGIRQRTMFTGAAESPQQLGAATTNTYKCISLPGGGLGPLPKRTYQLGMNSLDPPNQVRAPGFVITGLLVQGVVSPPAAVDAANVFLPIEWINTTSARRRWQFRRVRMWEAIGNTEPTQDIIQDITDVDIVSAPRPTYMQNMRADPSNPFNAGVPGVVAAWFAGAGGTSTNRMWFMFPPPAAPGTNAVTQIDQTQFYFPAITHQGRALGWQFLNFPNGTTGVFSSNENLWFTNSNLLSLQSTAPTLFGQEDPSGVSAAVSTSASELFIVKHNRGGYVVRGDVASPTVITLPGVVPAGNIDQVGPIATPVGVIYFVLDGGLFVWGGGQQSESISPQLEGDFWNIPSVGFAGTMCLFRDWVLIPNNWLYDWRQQSYWRIDDATLPPILHFQRQVAFHGWWGAPAFYTDHTTPVLYAWDLTVPSTSYRWQSQPFQLGEERIFDVREVVIIAQGNGTVTLTLIDNLTGATETEAFPFTGTAYPQTVARNIGRNAAGGFQGTYLQVQLDVDGGSHPAPIVYEVNIGSTQRAQVPTQ